MSLMEIEDDADTADVVVAIEDDVLSIGTIPHDVYRIVPWSSTIAVAVVDSDSDADTDTDVVVVVVVVVLRNFGSIEILMGLDVQ